ncbi:MAG: hypothetical protein PHU45_02810 [Bacilli bacterium]|nr:hypothetical protein [Bacilli bacterium]
MAGDSGVSKLLLALVGSLVFSSVIISFILMGAYGVNVSGLNLDTGITHYSPHQNFETCSYNDSTWFTLSSGEYSGWKPVCGSGLVYLGKTFDDTILHWPLTELTFSYVLFKNEQADGNGNIINNYYINNSVHSDYSIILKYTDSANQNEIIVDSTGYHIPNHFFSRYYTLGDLFFYPYADANTLENPVYRTVYNEEAKTAMLYLDGNLLFTATNLKISGFFDSTAYYGGLGAKTNGFTLKLLDTDNQVVSDNVGNILNQVIGFMGTIIKLCLWNVDEIYLPAIANLILIKTQIAGIIICIIVIMRG